VSPVLAAEDDCRLRGRDLSSTIEPTDAFEVAGRYNARVSYATSEAIEAAIDRSWSGSRAVRPQRAVVMEQDETGDVRVRGNKNSGRDDRWTRGTCWKRR